MTAWWTATVAGWFAVWLMWQLILLWPTEGWPGWVGLNEARRLSEQGQAELWEESSCKAGDLGLGLMDDMFLHSSDEPVDSGSAWHCRLLCWICVSWVGYCEASWTSMNSECLGQQGAAPESQLGGYQLSHNDFGQVVHTCAAVSQQCNLHWCSVDW